jgi:tetratricopeptide (TPR) repeat protein
MSGDPSGHEVARPIHRAPPPGVVLDRTTILKELEHFAQLPDRRLFVLSGMPGIGKTTVAAELARRSSHLFARTIWIECRREERSVDAFLNLLHSSLGEPSHNREFLALLQATRDDPWFRWLAGTVVDELRRNHLLIVFDDFENWLDIATGQVADRGVRQTLLAATQGDHPCKIVLITGQRTVLDPSGVEVPFGAIEEEELFGLPSDEAVELLERSGMRGQASAVLRKAAEIYDGNPLALRLFANLVTREQRDPAELLSPRGAATVLDRLIGESIKDLSANLVLAAQALAVLRQPLARDALDAAGLDLRTQILPLQDRLMVQTRPQGFVLAPLFRAYALTRLDVERQQRLHHRAASLWQRRASDPKDWQSLEAIQPTLEQAFHLGQAGCWPEAAFVLVPAARHLLRLGYIDIAARETERVLPHLDPSEVKAQLLLVIGQVADWLGDYDQACRHFERALTQDSVTGQTRCEALYRLGRVHGARNEFPEATRLLEEAIQTSVEQSALWLQARALMSLAWIERESAVDAHKVLTRFREALDAAQRANDARTQSEAHRQIGFLLWDAFDETFEAKAHYREALELGPLHNDTKEITAVHTDLAYLCAEWGELLLAEEHARSAIELCKRSGNGYTLGNAYWNMGNLEERQRQWKSALDWFEQSRAQCERSGNRSGTVQAWMRIARSRFALQDRDGAWSALELADRLCSEWKLTFLLEEVRKEAGRLEGKESTEEQKRRPAPSQIIHIQGVNTVEFGHRINVGGNAIINIDTILKNTTQTIHNASSLPDEKRKELSALVAELESEMDGIKANYQEECKEVAEALEKAISRATEPQPKKSMLEVSAKGLKEAAQLLADVAPAVLQTATRIATFIVGLV